MQEKEFWGYKELEVYFSIGHQTIRKWVKEGKFPPGMKLGKKVIWPREVVEMFGSKIKAKFISDRCE